jgi:hypothetical protein
MIFGQCRDGIGLRHLLLGVGLRTGRGRAEQLKVGICDLRIDVPAWLSATDFHCASAVRSSSGSAACHSPTQ